MSAQIRFFITIYRPSKGWRKKNKQNKNKQKDPTGGLDAIINSLWALRELYLWQQSQLIYWRIYPCMSIKLRLKSKRLTLCGIHYFIILNMLKASPHLPGMWVRCTLRDIDTQLALLHCSVGLVHIWLRFGTSSCRKGCSTGDASGGIPRSSRSCWASVGFLWSSGDCGGAGTSLCETTSWRQQKESLGGYEEHTRIKTNKRSIKV